MVSTLLLAFVLARPGALPPNRLATELSSYLRQHAEDAVAWVPWGAEALTEARRRDRLVLVVIGHSACHACQTLDRAVLGDGSVSETVNARFVPVRVDREARPEVEEALRARAGLPRSGDSEPLVVAVDAEGLPVQGGVYGGPSDRRDEFRRWLARLPAATPTAANPSAGTTAPPYATSTPLLPPFGVLRLQIAQAGAGDAGAGRSLVDLLDAMARGGIRDHVGGGFHHGAHDAEWRVPWFEKLLADNALLIRAYAQAFGLTSNLFYRDVVKDTVAWAIRETRDPSGAFLTSVSATTEGEEGRFYLWTREEILATLGPERGGELLSVYRLEPPGVLQLTGSPFAGLGGSREVLQVRRARRVRPAVDDKVLAGWNGMMIGALATSGSLIRRGSDLEAARRAAVSILERMGPAPTLRHFVVGGAPGGSAVLEDYAFLAEGLLDLHEATGEARWRDEARALADAAVARFWDVAGGGFFATDARHAPLPARVRTAKDGARPSANGVMAAVLLRLGRLTGQRRYTQLGQRTIEAFAAERARDPVGFETLAAASRLRPSPPPSR